MVLEFRILIVSRIPDSLSCILDSKAQDSRFHKQIRIPLHGATNYSSFIIFSADGLLQKLYLIQHSGPSMAEQLSWCLKVFRATYLCNLVDSLTLAGRSQLFLGMGRRYGSRCGAERSAGCTKYMEPGQLERKNQTDRGLGEKTKKNIQVRQTFM